MMALTETICIYIITQGSGRVFCGRVKDEDVSSTGGRGAKWLSKKAGRLAGKVLRRFRGRRGLRAPFGTQRDDHRQRLVHVAHPEHRAYTLRPSPLGAD